MANKTIVVTGCGTGIGKEIAKLLLARGDRVCALDINLAPMQELTMHAKTPDQLLMMRCDVRDPAEWETAFAAVSVKWGKIDVLINNAGLFHVGAVETLTVDCINQLIDTNLKGVMFGTLQGAKHMLPYKTGHIVNLSSVAGILAPVHFSLYGATKYGVRGFTLAAAQDLSEHGIKVTCVVPNIVASPMIMNEESLQKEAVSYMYANGLLKPKAVAEIIVNKVLVKAPVEIIIPARLGPVVKAVSMVTNLSLLKWIKKIYQNRGNKIRLRLLSQLKEKKHE